MATPSPRRSPLAMIVLTLLAEGPMHAYRMQQLLRSRDKESVVNVASRNSIHQVLDRLQRDGLVVTSPREEPRSRIVYRSTAAGREAVQRWLAETLAEPRNEYPAFVAALSCVPLTSPAHVAELLSARLAALNGLLDTLQPERTRHEHGLERVFVIEDEYRRAIVLAERDWVAALIADLDNGSLDWPAGRA